MPAAEDRERLVHFRPRTVLVVVGILVASAIVLEVVWIARHVISWVFIALFLGLAWEFEVALPLLAKRTFGGGAGLYGLMSSFLGIGALCGGM